LGRLEVGWGKVACWSSKAAISLKRVKEKLLWMAYRNSPPLFRTVLSPTSYGLLFPKVGFANPNPNSNHHENFGRKESVGVSMDCPNFWGTPISGTA